MSETIKSHKCLEHLTLPQLVITRNSLSIMGDKPHDSLTKMCTKALRTLLDFLNKEISGHLCIVNLPNAFQNCRQCQAPTKTTIEKLLKLIANTNKLTAFSLDDCQLSEEQTNSIARSIPTSLTVVSLTGNITNTATVNKVLALAEFNLLELYIDGFTFKVNVDDKSRIRIVCCKNDKPQCYSMLSTLTFPSKLKMIKISNIVKFSLVSIVSPLLRNNPQIEKITLDWVETLLTCGEAIALADSLTTHTSLQRLSFKYNTKITKSTLLLRDLMLCPMSLQKLLTFLDPEQTKKIDLGNNRYTSFQDCSHCRASAAGGISTFFDVLDQSKNLKHLGISNCRLPANVIDTLASILLKKSLLEFVELTGNEVNAELFTRLLRLFSNVDRCGLFLTDISLHSTSECLSYTSQIKKLLPSSEFP